MATLDLINVSKRFGRETNAVNAVNDVNLTVSNGEFMCILGPSGCGKSTLLRMIAGFEALTSGDVQIDKLSVGGTPANRRPTAMVFQKYTLWPHMLVYDNIAFGLRLRHLSRPEIDRKVRQSLEMVGLGTYGGRFPSQLSGGEQQRVALARALVLEPKILLLDEPFSSLDALLRVRLREELHRIQRQIKITAIFVTHDQEEALSLADRIAVMNSGRIEQVDHPSNIYANPRSLFVADFIGVMNLLPGIQQGNRVLLGEQTLNLPDENSYHGAVTVAIRPEDMALVKNDDTGAWKGTLEQLIDLGHYRKALVNIPNLGTVKVYLPKSMSCTEGDTLALYPNRFLIYGEGQAPIEVKMQSNSQLSAVNA